jgi:chaperonin GroES
MASAHKAKFKLKPLADRIILKESTASEEMRGGLYIPDTAKEKPTQGVILAVGPGRLEKGERIPLEVQVGQTVLYSKYAGSPYRFGDDEVVVIKESDILAIIG